MKIFQILAALAVTAQAASEPPMEDVQEKLFETRLECIMQMKSLDPHQIDEVMYWFYLAGKIDQIDDTLELMEYYED